MDPELQNVAMSRGANLARALPNHTEAWRRQNEPILHDVTLSSSPTPLCCCWAGVDFIDRLSRPCLRCVAMLPVAHPI